MKCYAGWTTAESFFISAKEGLRRKLACLMTFRGAQYLENRTSQYNCGILLSQLVPTSLPEL